MNEKRRPGKPWYEELFVNYAATYDTEVFTQGTAAECDFIEVEIGRDKTRTILDVGCGTGRHAVELARRGYSVTGIDLSSDQLRRARQKARAVGAEVRFQRRDARRFRFKRTFDLVIMLCEGAFPLMETDEENYRILSNAAQAIAPGGKIVFTTLNVLYPLYHSVKDFVNNQATGGCWQETSTFDLLTFRDYSTVSVEDDDGNRKTLQCNERYYAPAEISWMLKALGFSEISILGCDTGGFSRGRPLTTDDFEMLVVARKI